MATLLYGLVEATLWSSLLIVFGSLDSQTGGSLFRSKMGLRALVAPRA